MTIRERMTVSFGTITIPPQAKQLALEALESTYVSSGRLVREFEERFAAIHGVPDAVAVSSGTDADTLALAVLHDYGASRGDEVLVPALSFVATGNAVLHAGLMPVFVDVDRETLNIDVVQIEAAITARTRAILPVHLMGKPAEMDTIMEIAKRHDLFVIEDAAEAHGAQYRERVVGTIGDMGAFSTFVAHIITTVEGGVVTAARDEYGEILRSLRSHGRACSCKRCVMSSGEVYCQKRFGQPGIEDIRFTFPRVGYSSKMNELEAAVGLGNLAIYEEILATRYRNLKYLLERFDRFAPYLLTFREEEHEVIGPHAFPILVGDDASFTRKDLIDFFNGYGIDSRTLFRSMPTQCAGFAHLGATVGDFPNAEWLADRGIHIGVHQDLTEAHMQYVLDVCEQFLAQHQK